MVQLQDFIMTSSNEALQHKVEQFEIFAHPTISGIANVLAQKAYDAQQKARGGDRKSKSKSLEEIAQHLVIHPDEWYPASHAQEQTFILNASGAGAAYNMPWIVDFKGKFNRDAMIQAHDFVVKKEQPLRTVLRLDSGNVSRNSSTVQQQILPKDLSRELWELVEHTAFTIEDAVSILEKEQDYIFDLSNPPIARLHIVRIDEGRHLVMCNSHHVHHDTGSVVTYRRHVLETYITICEGKADTLDESDNKFDYCAYAVWQRQALTPKVPEFKDQLSYWLNELKDARALTFPKDDSVTPDGASGGMVTLRK